MAFVETSLAAGRPMDRQLGDGWSQGVHPDDLQRCLHTYREAFDARQAFRMEYRLQRFDGEYRWVLDTGVPRFRSDGTFEGYIGSCIDITDRQRSREELETAHDELAYRVIARTAAKYVEAFERLTGAALA